MARKRYTRGARTRDGDAAANRAAAAAKADGPEPPPRGAILVDRSQLAPANSYGAPRFVMRGYYVDEPFRCVDCGSDEVWTAAQQKWWYEVAKGFIYSVAKRCRTCRRARRENRTGRGGS